MVNKRGDVKWDIIVALILGLLVLTLSLFFIFNEYFTEDELNWQQCRQSIILRTNMPEIDLKALEYDLKDAFPLKCKTEVVIIESADPEEVYGKISKAVAEGWYMFGEGKFDFIHKDWLTKQINCLVFARIHYTDEAVKEFAKEIGKDPNEVNSFLGDLAKVKEDSDIDAITGVNYGQYIEPFRKIVDYNKEFYEYYSENNVPGSKGSYNEYLPLLSRDSRSSYFYPMTEVYPRNSDLLLVYKIPGASVASNSPLGNIFTGGIVGGAVIVVVGIVSGPPGWIAAAAILGGGVAFATVADQNFWGHETEELLKKERGILLATPETLETIKCTKFLTIPA